MWGQSLHVVMCYIFDRDVKKIYNLLMNTEDGDLWTLETSVFDSRQHRILFFEYCYQVEDSDGRVVRKEWNLIKRAYSFDETKDYVFSDFWRDIPLNYYLYTNTYINIRCLNIEKSVDLLRIPLYRKSIIFRVSAPQLKKNEILAVCGSHPILGDWGPSRYLKMTHIGEYDWILSVNIDRITLPLEYKYVVVDKNNEQIVSWEDGDNRETGAYQLSDGQVLVLYGDNLHVNEGQWKIAGVVVPVFSLRSVHSYGVGDFSDLKRMIDWAFKCGIKLIQILPVNDTTNSHSWTDSNPYNAISVFALHPHYLDVEKLGELKDNMIMTTYHRQQRELNELPYSDYLAVDRIKQSYINDIFKERGQEVLNSKEFDAFFTKNRDWLLPYAAFAVLRDKYQTSCFNKWEEYSEYDDKKISALCSKDSKLYYEIQKIFYIQFNLYVQLKEASDYAHSKGVALKGDLQIGVSKYSVETWVHPNYFNIHSQMGVPPDNSNLLGQNWGYPSYNWLAIENDDYAWWHRRIAYLENFFDAIRVDHIIAFFRSWEIPDSNIFGNMGIFSPSLPLSIEEINNFGLTFHYELFTHPYINDEVLTKVFGIHSAYVKEHFLINKSYNLYELRNDFNNQIKIRDYFKDNFDENSLWIRDGLYRLISNVLFIEDPYTKGVFHPRFAVYNEPVYEILSPEEKDSYMRIYNNYFYERHNDYWYNIALQKLSEVFSKTRMLICGEDLGILPKCVAPALERMRIFSLCIQSMPKTHGNEFAHLEANIKQSVATITTHDMPTMRLWWEENYPRTQRFYSTMLQKQGNAPIHLSSTIAEEIIMRHLYCPSMICALSIQDWLSMDNELRNKDIYAERINSPSDIYNRWKYRMNVTIESLMNSEHFNKKIKMMIKRSRR